MAEAKQSKSGKSPAARVVDILAGFHLACVCLILLGILIISSAFMTLMSMLGVIPWLEIAATLGGHPIPGLGPMVQIMFTLFCASLLAFLPASSRILKLEKAHREFNLNLSDIERAYRAAHAEDRAGVFMLSDEFGAVRERLAFLRKHPDLAHIEPEILETAAQMSFLSRDLAVVYSDEAVARAKSFLAQRQDDVERQAAQIEMAASAAKELKRWMSDVEAEERVARTQIKRLEADLQDILPKISSDLTPPGVTVLPISKPRVAKRRDIVELN